MSWPGYTQVSMRLERAGSGEERAVDGIDNRLSRDLPAAKETAVQSFDSILAASDAVELQVDVALGIRI